jgi:hypothetical protein
MKKITDTSRRDGVFAPDALACCICGHPIETDLSGWRGGHNARPAKNGRCCSDCNSMVVIPMRIRMIYACAATAKAAASAPAVKSFAPDPPV